MTLQDCIPEQYEVALTEWLRYWYQRVKEHKGVTIAQFSREIGIDKPESNKGDNLRKLLSGVSPRWRIQHLCCLCVGLKRYFEYDTTPAKILHEIEGKIAKPITPPIKLPPM